jgi:hypothetical protein
LYLLEIFVSLQMLLFQQGQEMVLAGVAGDPTGTWVGDLNPGPTPPVQNDVTARPTTHFAHPPRG